MYLLIAKSLCDFVKQLCESIHMGGQSMFLVIVIHLFSTRRVHFHVYNLQLHYQQKVQKVSRFAVTNMADTESYFADFTGAIYLLNYKAQNHCNFQELSCYNTYNNEPETTSEILRK